MSEEAVQSVLDKISSLRYWIATHPRIPEPEADRMIKKIDEARTIIEHVGAELRKYG